LETFEVKAAEDEDLDWSTYSQVCNALTGILKALGLESRMDVSFVDDRGTLRDTFAIQK